MTRFTVALALLTAVAAPVAAEQWDVAVTTPIGEGLFYFPAFPAFTAPPSDHTGTIFEPGPFSFGPVAGYPFDLGAADKPWSAVYAERFVAGGRPGLTVTVRLSNTCALRFKGGLLVALIGVCY